MRARSVRIAFKAALLAGAAALSSTVALAQTATAGAASGDTSFAIGEVVVTAARLAPVQTVLTSVDILGPDIAQRQNVDSTFMVLGRLPGVLVTDFHQGGTNGSVSFRGFNAEGGISAVKLLIDGVPSNSNDGYMWLLDGVAPLELASVEVVRGTSDPRYGLHNIAGNINILTRQGGDYADVKATVGSYATYEVQGAVGVQAGDFSQNYAVDYRRSAGFRDHARSDRKILSGKWFYAPGRFRIGAVARYFESGGEDPGFLSTTDAETRPRVSPALNIDDGRQRRGGEYSLHGDLEVSDTLSVSLKGYANQFQDTRFFRIASTVAQQERQLSEHQQGAIATVRYHPQVSFLHDLTLEGGADVQEQTNHHVRWLGNGRSRASVAFNRDFNLTVYGGYLQAVIAPTPWLKITPAYRVDWVDGDFTNRVSNRTFPTNDYGAINQPKISAVITPIDGLSVYGNYGRTFQIGLGVSTFVVPPQVSNVRPSINEGWEAGVKYKRGRWLEARVAAWRQTATGEVLLQNFTGDFVNLGSTKREGVDAQLSLNPSAKMSLWGAFSWQRGIIVVPDPATPTYKGNRIDHVPAYLVSGGVDYRPIEPLRLSLSYNGQTKYELDASNSRGKFGDLSVANLEVAYKVTPNIEISGEVKNLTGNRSAYVYYDPTTRSALNSPHDGRAAYASVRVAY